MENNVRINTDNYNIVYMYPIVAEQIAKRKYRLLVYLGLLFY